MSEKFSGRELVAAVAGPKQWADNRKSWLARAAHRAGISARQVKALFYGEITDPDHRSARLMRDALERRADGLANKFEKIAQVLNAAGAELYGDDAAALVELARRLRGEDRP